MIYEETNERNFSRSKKIVVELAKTKYFTKLLRDKKFTDLETRFRVMGFFLIN